MATVSYTSNVPQHDVGLCLGLYIAWPSLLRLVVSVHEAPQPKSQGLPKARGRSMLVASLDPRSPLKIHTKSNPSEPGWYFKTASWARTSNSQIPHSLLRPASQQRDLRPPGSGEPAVVRAYVLQDLEQRAIFPNRS